MTPGRGRRARGPFIALVLVVTATITWTVAGGLLAAAGASGLLHPYRRPLSMPTPAGCVEAVFAGAGLRLTGWRCVAQKIRRGSVVYLHGVADNRGSAVGVIARFRARGFDVVAYDSRAHGQSEGGVCTYGFYETQDLKLVVDTLSQAPVVLVGTSLGAAVALQHAAIDPRTTAVVAAETFSDLRTVASERAPFFFSGTTLQRAFSRAEQYGRFVVDAVSPVRAAARITAPVFLVHGLADVATPPDHSRRVFDALRGDKHLRLVPGAGHGESLRGAVWEEVERWLQDVLVRH